jgi:hypothetical protein
VNAAFAAFDQRFLAPAPPTRLAALRVLVGLFGTIFLVARASYLLDISALPDNRFEPVGVWAWLDSPLPVWLVRTGIAAGVALGIAFIAGWRFRVIAPAYAIVLLALTTYDNSWQHVAHTENLFVLHTIVLTISPAAVAWSLDARRTRVRVREGTRDPAPEFGWPVRVMSIITVLTYVLAGWAKLRHGGMNWISGDVLRNQIAHDNVRKIVLGDVHSPIGGWLVRHGWLFPPMALGSVAVELGAPIALLRGKLRSAWIIGAWLFHVLILALMAILFIYPLTGIAFASMARPERAGEWLIRTRRGYAPAARGDAPSRWRSRCAG